MKPHASRRQVLGAISGIAAFSVFGGVPVAAQAEGLARQVDAAQTGQVRYGRYWGITRSNADTVVTSNTDGGVRSNGTVYVTRGVEIDGSVTAGGSVVLEPGVDVDGNIDASGAVVTGSGVDIDGNIDAEIDVLLGTNLERNRAAFANNQLGGLADVIRGRNVDVDGNVTAGRDVLLAPQSEIDGDVDAGRIVALGRGSEVYGQVSGESVRRQPGADVGPDDDGDDDDWDDD